MSVCIKDLIQNMNLVIGCTVGCDYCYARNNVRRWHMIEDFRRLEFFPEKLRLMEKPCPHNFLLTGMSDLAGKRNGGSRFSGRLRRIRSISSCFCPSGPIC